METTYTRQNILDTVQSIIDEGEYDVYGLRVLTVTTKEDESLPAPAIGSVLANSRVWDDGEMLDEELNGTCTVGLNWDADEYDITRAVRLLGEGYTGYTGRYVVLVGGNDYEGGQDAGEYIISNATVLAVWDRGPEYLHRIRVAQ